jgi:hypothetical protein
MDVERLEADLPVLAQEVKQHYGVDAAGKADGDFSARRLP